MKKLYVTPITRKLTGTVCPQCGRPADGGTNVDDECPAPSPKPGDYCVCLYCGGFHRYDAALKLVALDRKGRRKLARDPRLSELMAIGAAFAQQRRRSWQ